MFGPESGNALNATSDVTGVYLEQGKFAQAEALDRLALGIGRRVFGPGTPMAAWFVGLLLSDYCLQGKHAQVEALFQEALESNPTNPFSLKYLAWSRLTLPDRRHRRPQEALQLARRAVKGEPREVEFYLTLGMAAYRNELWDEAIANLNRAAEMDKGNVPTDFFFLAMAHWNRGDKGEAEQFFQRGVERASKTAAADMELRMFWSEAAELLGKPGPVPTLFEAQAEPERVMASLKRGVAAGRFDAATLETSPDLAPLRGRADFRALLRTARSPAKSAR